MKTNIHEILLKAEAQYAAKAKTLTYGTLPSFETFETAMNNTFGSDNDDTVRYDIQPRGTDARMFAALNLDLECGTLLTGFRYNAEQLYALCEALNEAFNSAVQDDGVSSEDGEWAHAFCSSILTTLGFEWV